MPILDNPKHERFAQAMALGKSADQAYVIAGYSEHRSNAARLSANERVRRRIEEILSEAAAKVGVTVERVVTELAKIGFSDIRKAVSWRGSLVRESDNPDGGDVLVIKEIVTNHVQVVDSDQVDDDTAGAIAEVSQTKDGMKIKMHSKPDALEKLGRYLGMFKDKVEHSGPGGGPIETSDVSDRERARAMLLLATKAKSAT